MLNAIKNRSRMTLIILTDETRSQSTLVRSVSIFGSLQLNLESFHANLKSVHGLNGSLGAGLIVKANKTCHDTTL